MIHPKKLTADDRAEINELFGKYAWAGDTGDVEGYVGAASPRTACSTA